MSEVQLHPVLLQHQWCTWQLSVCLKESQVDSMVLVVTMPKKANAWKAPATCVPAYNRACAYPTHGLPGVLRPAIRTRLYGGTSPATTCQDTAVVW